MNIELSHCYNNGFDDGKEEMKYQIKDIIDKYQCGPYDDKTQDILYKLRKEIEKL